MANQWQRFKNKTVKKLERLSKNTTLTVGKLSIKRSPVDTGLFKESWVTAIGAPINSQGATGAGLLPVVASSKLGDQIFFTNSLPYAFRLEFGWSNQAPFGIVRIIAANWQLIVDDQVKRIGT